MVSEEISVALCIKIKQLWRRNKKTGDIIPKHVTFRLMVFNSKANIWETKAEMRVVGKFLSTYADGNVSVKLTSDVVKWSNLDGEFADQCDNSPILISADDYDSGHYKVEAESFSILDGNMIDHLDYDWEFFPINKEPASDEQASYILATDTPDVGSW